MSEPFDLTQWDTKPDEFVQTVVSHLGIPLTIEGFRHTERCGPRGDPGPRDDFGQRWHNCWRVMLDGEPVSVGRGHETIKFLEGIVFGVLAAKEAAT